MADEVKPTTEPDPYDLGDTSIPLETPAQTPPETPAPRDPDTGRFVKATHPDWLTRAAGDLGLEPEDFADLTTDQLGRTVSRLQRQHVQQLTQRASERTVTESQVREPAQPRATVEAEPDLGFDLSDFGPEIQQAFKALHGKFAARVQELEGQLAGIGQREQLREGATATERLDNAFEALGASYQTLLGDGSAADFEARSPEMLRRLAVIQAADLKPADLASQKAMTRKIRAAAEQFFGALLPKETPKPSTNGGPKPRVTPEEWDAAGIAPPTDRRGAPEPKGEALAVKNLKNRLREAGLPGDSEITDGLLE